mmetsp:Transcript_1545/g.3824  ORF Transcript_1545/g.3824 Transcript_1545/m.3824 type:complete len:98 (-) Transcript_1545:87-380(-)
MNAIMVLSKVGVWFVVVKVSRMPTIVVNAYNRPKIETDVQKLSTWGRPRLICFMNERNMVSRNDDTSSMAYAIFSAQERERERAMPCDSLLPVRKCH